MKLRELLAGAAVADVEGDDGIEIEDLAYDSRRARRGTLFFCVVGRSSDGHDFAPGAVEAGAAALVVERRLDLPVTQVTVPDARAAMAPIALRFWDDPTRTLRVAGITGTNGKTTTAFLIRHVLEAAGISTGLLGTVKRIVGGAEEEVERTTPEAIDLQETFARMLAEGDAACAMEVSSHALALERTGGVRFAVAVFTNLTQDHLDFHGDMQRYFEAKRRLFFAAQDAAASGAATAWRPPDVAVINIDDPYGSRLADEIRATGHVPLTTFSPGGDEAADLRAVDVAFDAGGSSFVCASREGDVEVRMPLPGDFNVENALAALAACHELGVPLGEAASSLANAGRVPGRFEPVDEGQPFAVLVDYAHTPDSLENVLSAARRLTEGRLAAVFGCGGDRDREKRPLMGEIAARLSDRCVVTSDNPRSEDPAAIIAQILSGIPGLGADQGRRGDVIVEPDRRIAMRVAFEDAGPGDTVIVAGKGHEQGQEFEHGRKVPFDDRQVAREELRRLRSRSPA